jgi:hypothetical protein
MMPKKRGRQLGRAQQEEDPMVFKSRVKGKDLCETMSNDDMFEEDIKKGYGKDAFCGKVVRKGEINPLFRVHNG